MNVPNIITIVGIMGIALYTRAVLNHNFLIMIAGFGIATLSDFLDGFAARRLKQETEIGGALDAIRDRLLLIAVLFNFIFIEKQLMTAYDHQLIILLGVIEALIWLMVITTYVIRGIQIKSDIVGKVRQGGHIVLMALALISTYSGVKLLSLERALPGMVTLSFLAFIFYTARNWFIWNRFEFFHATK